MLLGELGSGSRRFAEHGRKLVDGTQTGKTLNTLPTSEVFHTVCGLYAPFLRKQDTCLRAAIAVEKRMAIVLYWLAHAVVHVCCWSVFHWEIYSC